MAIETITRNKWVSQHNFLVRAPQRMTPLELRLFTLALACLDKDDRELRQIRVPFSSLFPDEPHSNAYVQLKKACKGLMALSLELEVISSHKRRKTDYFSVISHLSLDEGTGLITGHFHEMIEEYLIHLTGNFTTLEIEFLLNLKNHYAVRLCWLLKSYHLGHYSPDVETFRQQMLGAKAAKVYPEWFDFNRFVLKPALDELNSEGISWGISCEEIRISRKIIALKFIIPPMVKDQAVKDQAVKEPQKNPRALPAPGGLQLPAWLVDHPTRDGALQYQHLVNKFGLGAGEARRIVEGLVDEADFLRLTKTMFAVLTPKAGEPPIANLAAVLKARLAR